MLKIICERYFSFSISVSRASEQVMVFNERFLSFLVKEYQDKETYMVPEGIECTRKKRGKEEKRRRGEAGTDVGSH